MGRRRGRDKDEGRNPLSEIVGGTREKGPDK